MTTTHGMEVRSYRLQVVTLLVTIAGGILGYFFLYRPLNSLEVASKRIEVAEKSTPNLGVTATSHVGTINESTEFVHVETLLENLGDVPIQLGDISLK